MKQAIKPLCITLFSLLIIFQMASADQTSHTETTIGIGQLMNNADQYSGSVIVHGIVSKVFPQDKLIGLIDKPNPQRCDVKKCTKPCDMPSTKECPMKNAKDCSKTCSMAAVRNTDPNNQQDAVKKCPMAPPFRSGKACPMAADKSCAKRCSMADAKTCTHSSSPLTLPVQWDGEMPELSSDVHVVGKIMNKDGRLLFVAESIRVMSN